MQRWSAILLLALFGLLPIAPALQADSDSTLPDCCRKAGKHHCSMSIGVEQVDEESGLTLKSNSTACPLYSQVKAAPARANCIAAPESALFFAAIVIYPTAHAQIEAHYRVSFSRAWQKRGPPSIVS